MLVKLFVIYLNQLILSNCLQCVDENNKPVDWYVVYKIPKLNHQNPLAAAGTAYIYLTSDDYSSWKLWKNYIDQPNSIIGNTIKPLYTDPNIVSLIYNDQPPNTPSIESKGHTKGIILADEQSGFWLIHSVPHFPVITDNYTFPTTGVIYGQSFLCISLDLKNLNEIGIQLQYNEPQIFHYNIPEHFKDIIPNIVNVASGVTVKSSPWFRKTNIESLGGINFVSYAKSRKFLKDLYEDWLAPDLQSDLYVETWPKGPGKLSSNCSYTFKVYNVETVNLKNALTKFNSTHDHSKWAISEISDASNWICIGDINRMEHQKSRGGGTVCLKNKILSNLYLKQIVNIEKCLTKD